MAWLDRLGLRWQVMLGVLLGLLGAFTFIGVVAARTIDHSTAAALEERLSMAQFAARGVDALVARAADQLEEAANLPALSQGMPEEREELLAHAFRLLGSFERVSLSSGDGRVEISYPPLAPGEEDAQSSPASWLPTQVLREGRVQVFRPPASPEGTRPVAMVFAPIVGPEGTVVGGLLGELRLTFMGGELVPLPGAHKGSAPTMINSVLVDEEGSVLAASGNIGTREGLVPREHIILVNSFLHQQEPGVAVHRPAPGLAHVVAFAPTQSAPGGVIVEDIGDAILAVPERLERTILVFGSMTLVIASLLSWLYARRIVRPLGALTEAANRIAGGDLERPVRVDRADEIGTLARRFESMRRRLLAARRQAEQGERELEERVKERTAQVRSLLGKVISAQEEERKRIARDLHDGALQELAALLVAVHAAAGTPSLAGTKDAAALERAAAMLEATVHEVRKIILDLRPPALDDLGLVAALRQYAEGRTRDAGLHLTFETSGSPDGLDSATETAVFRIFQEAITNAVKHSGCRNLTVRLEFLPDRMTGGVADDGSGFDRNQALEAPGVSERLGLAGIQERVDLLQGLVDITSRPGEGTRLHIDIPMRREALHA